MTPAFPTRRASDLRRTPGIRVAEPAFDLAACREWKDGIVNRLTNGVAALLKKARVKTVEGVARFRDGKRSEEHTSELQSLMRSSYAVFCLKKKKSSTTDTTNTDTT